VRRRDKRCFSDGRRSRARKWHENVSRDVAVVRGWDPLGLQFGETPSSQDGEQPVGPTWNDVEAVWPRLHREERVVLQLVRDGKTPTDVAEILNLADRRRAHDLLERVVNVVRFYTRWSDALERLPDCALSEKYRRVAILYAKHRMPFKEIARRVKCVDKHVHVILARVRETLREAGEDDVVAMLEDCGGMYMGKRKDDGDAGLRWRAGVSKWLQANLGKVWYEWGGQNIAGGVADCSGLVIEVFKKFGVLPAGFRDTTAQGLADYFSETANLAVIGDLAFYGKSAKKVAHVMIWIGDVDGRKNMVAGMCNGARNMKAEWARKIGAGLWLRSMRYRRDFLFVRKVK